MQKTIRTIRSMRAVGYALASAFVAGGVVQFVSAESHSDHIGAIVNTLQGLLVLFLVWSVQRVILRLVAMNGSLMGANEQLMATMAQVWQPSDADRRQPVVEPAPPPPLVAEPQT